MIPKVNRGDRLRIRAQDWNEIADHVNETSLAASAAWRHKGLHVLNATDADRLAGMCLKVGGPVASSLDDGFADVQVLSATIPQAGETGCILGILSEDVASGDIGRISLSGACYALFSSYDSTLQYAEPDGYGRLKSSAIGSIEVVCADSQTLQGVVIIGGVGGARGGYFDLSMARDGDGWACTVFNSGETELSGSANGYEISGRVVVGNHTEYMPITSVEVTGPGVVYLHVEHDGQSHGGQPYLGFSSGFAFASAMPSVAFDDRMFQAPLGYLRYRNGTDASDGYIVTRTSHSRGGAIELSGRWI